MTIKGQHKNITEEEVKKIITEYIKVYDPEKNNYGYLISNSQTVSQSTDLKKQFLKKATLPIIKKDLTQTNDYKINTFLKNSGNISPHSSLPRGGTISFIIPSVKDNKMGTNLNFVHKKNIKMAHPIIFSEDKLYNRRNNEIIKYNDSLVEERQISNEMEKIEEMVLITKGPHKNITEEEVKKIVRIYINAYDPRKNSHGNLISNSQIISQLTKDDKFNDRYKVFQKMNKLSDILLSKNKIISIDTDIKQNNSSYKIFDKMAFDRTVIEGQKLSIERKQKFLNACLLNSKELNNKNRTKFKYQKQDKGGIVNLAQIIKKEKFKIRKFKANGSGHNTINPKYRAKAVKIVQAWWRLIKIQSVLRGKYSKKFVNKLSENEEEMNKNENDINFIIERKSKINNEIKRKEKEKEISLNEKKQEFEIKEKSLKEKEDKLKEQNNILSKKEEEINKKEKLLNEKEIKLSNEIIKREKEIKEKENILKNELKIMKEELEKVKENALNEKENKLLLTEKDFELKEKEYKLSEENKKLSEKKLLKINFYLNRIIELEDEKKELKKILPFEILKGEKIISIIFISVDQKILYSIICKNTDIDILVPIIISENP